MTKQALLIFAKNPVAGKVKTRLAATMGNEAALAIYNLLLLYTVSETEYLPVDKFVFYSDHIGQEDIWDSKHYYKEVQEGKDLGERMNNALGFIFRKGYDKVVIIGTDCPELSAGMIMNAFDYLQDYDVIIGPAGDGGYYLLGMKEQQQQLFEDMKWSTSAVLPDTVCRCETTNLQYYLLPVLNDIDEEKDLLTTKLHRP